MSSAEQIRALVQSYRDGNEEHFYAVALQLAAVEAKKGHSRLADDIRQLVESAKGRKKAVALHQPRGELAALLVASYPSIRTSDLVIDPLLRRQTDRIISEQRSSAAIEAMGLSARRKLLLVGAPGTGKTMTAAALAGELGLPLFLIRLDVLITKFMGETASRLRQVFDAISSTRGVYFFDEFDAIGSQRGATNDVGEARRILNSFLQMLEHDASHSLVIAATNHPEILDGALLRRFDDVLHYSLPENNQIVTLLRSRLGNFAPTKLNWQSLAETAAGLSHAEVVKAAEDAVKEAIISGSEIVTSKQVSGMLLERRTMSDAWRQLQNRK